MKLAVIVDKGMLQRFALDALDSVEGVDEIAVFSCTNTRLKKRWLHHGAYYALNLFSVRNRLTCFVPVTSGRKRVARTIEFASEYDGAWQRLPSQMVDALKAGNFDAILKFGMGLLRVPPREQLPISILSYHHGDPGRYRGRPAGFWEIVDGAKVMGQIVQVIGNKLDAGQVVAYAETKVFPWSYRATLIQAFRHSPLIIDQAIRNAVAGRTLSMPGTGRNCRLPSNGQTIVFALKMASQFATRVLYGAFAEKAWKVSTAPLPTGHVPELLGGRAFPAAGEWQSLPVAREYRFYSDPFYSRELGAVLVEALVARTGKGAIVNPSEQSRGLLIKERGHLSYPSTAIIAGREIIVPECASWSAPRFYAIEDGALKFAGIFRVQDDVRVTDPTIFERDGRIFLFGNIRDLGSGVLHLWSSVSLEGEFTFHPMSPIRLSPEGSRMGGALIEHDGRLFRLGQDFTGSYGDGLISFEIGTLTPDTYAERQIGRIRFHDRKGPHTLNFRDGEIVFDWYVDRFSAFAALRRLRGRRRR